MAETKSSSRIFLLSSLALGVIAMVAAFVYLENTAGQDHGPKVMILVARHDLRENSPLDPEKDLDLLEIPSRLTDLRSRTLNPELRVEYKGQRVNRTVLAGTPIWLMDLAATATLELRGDARAMSLQVKRSADALSGLLVPGDHVQLLVTRSVPAKAASISAAATAPSQPDGAPESLPRLYETVIVSSTPFKVLAVNQRLSRSRSQVTAAEAYQSGGDSSANLNVTLEVTEAQAKNILEQTGAGQLPVTFVLCPPTAPGSPAAAVH